MNNIIPAIVIMAGVTYAVRALPVCIFKKQLTSRWIRSFLFFIPYAVLGAMTFPAILYATSDMISAAAGLAAAIILAYLNKGLMTTALGAVVVVYITELLL